MTGNRGTGGGMRIGHRLGSRADWLSLVGGDVDAIHLYGFASSAECDELVSFAAPRMREYGAGAVISRYGSSFSDALKTSSVRGEYTGQDVLSEALAISGAISRLIGQVTASWPLGAETFVYDDMPLHRGIFRRITAGGAEPHDDSVTKEVSHDATAASLAVQIGVNLYLEIPSSGGALEGWRLRLTGQEYEAARNPERGRDYGVRREAIGPSDWRVLPARGDVVLFRSSEIHAITDGSGARTTWGFFLGFRDEHRSLLMWS